MVRDLVPGQHRPGAFVAYSKYDHYLLFTDTEADITKIPVRGVRLVDHTIARVIQQFKASILHQNWPADFDKNGMIRATRVPLGPRPVVCCQDSKSFLFWNWARQQLGCRMISICSR